MGTGKLQGKDALECFLRDTLLSKRLSTPFPPSQKRTNSQNAPATGSNLLRQQVDSGLRNGSFPTPPEKAPGDPNRGHSPSCE